MLQSMEAVLERSKRLEDLRKDVSEVMEIFQDVKELVHHQHERVESIGDHVQEAKDNVNPEIVSRDSVCMNFFKAS